MTPRDKAPLPSLADDLCARLNMRGIGRWLEELARMLDCPLEAVMPRPPRRDHRVSIETRGLQLVLDHPHAGHVNRGDPDRWLITEAKFGMAGQYGTPWLDTLPFELDADAETPATAAARLGAMGESLGLSRRSVSLGDLRQTWFLHDALTIELTWHLGGRGITHLWALRLGGDRLDRKGSCP